MGRGYTDLAAALLAAGLGAIELQIWKEVDGIFTADPRKVPTARLIPVISPEEAAELTYYGSEVVHPFTMEQACIVILMLSGNLFLMTPIPGHPEENPHTHQERGKSAWPRHGHRPRSGPRVIRHDADARFWRRLCRRGPQQRGDGQRRHGRDDPAPTGPDGRDDQGAHRRVERAVESEERLARLPRWHIRHSRPLWRRRGPHQHERGLRQYGDRGRPRSKALRAPRTRPGENRHRVYPRFFLSLSRSLARLPGVTSLMMKHWARRCPCTMTW